MKSFFIATWLKNTSIARKLYFTMGIMALLIIAELVTLWFAINTLSSVRAYVGGEGLWSKAQKDAIYQLGKYYRTHDQADYLAFKNFMKVPQGDHKARMEMMKAEPDWDIARQGFLEGRNHPKDIDKMISLFLRFHDVSYINKAIRIWTAADPYAMRLDSLGDLLHAEITSATPSKQKMDSLIQQVDPINQQVTILEDDFSYTLGEGSRWLEQLILKLLFAVALTVEISGLLLTISVSRGITRGIKAIVSASKSIASGDFGARAKAFSKDELGLLANSFNKMADDLEERRHRQKHAEEDLKRQKELYETLVKAQSEMGEGVAITEGQKIVFANPALCKMYGYPEAEMQNLSSFIELVTEEEQIRLHSRMQERMNGKLHPDTGETIVKRKDGGMINIEYSFKKIEMEGRQQVVSIIRDITQRKQAEEKIKESELRFNRAFMASPAGMVISSLETGIIIEANESFLKMIGFTREEVIGRSAIEANFIREEVGVGVMNELKQNGKIQNKEIEFTRKNGDKGTELLSAEVIVINGEECILSILIDITERRNAEMSNIQKTEELERSNKELEQFAYIASHDLQEPLRIVTSYVQLLEKRYKDKLGKEADEYISFTVDATARMRLLINDLLSYSRVGKQPKEFTEVDINDVLKTVAINLRVRIQESKAQLRIDPMPIVKADESQMRQLFQNLISNAIKFKSDKTPDIKISGEKKGNYYLFAVEDNGIGISKEYENKIFQLFQRLNDRSKYPGTGIGLAVCKKIIELHGGQIWIEPNEQEGTTFYFTIGT